MKRLSMLIEACMCGAVAEGRDYTQLTSADLRWILRHYGRRPSFAKWTRAWRMAVAEMEADPVFVCVLGETVRVEVNATSDPGIAV